MFPASGPTMIRVDLMWNAARRNEAANDTLTVGVTSETTAALAPETGRLAERRQFGVEPATGGMSPASDLRFAADARMRG
jgi:hypothetical protein